MTSESAPGEAHPTRARELPWVVLVVLGAAAVSLIGIGQGAWIDDSFISYRYARQLVEGNGFVYNAGDPVEGYSNFLWALVAALGIACKVEPIHFTQAVSLLAQAATLAIVCALGRLAGHRGGRALIAPLLLAGSVGFLEYPMTGMETTAFTLLVALSFLLLRRERYGSPAGAIALGLALLAMATTRFDGFVLAGVLLAYPLLFHRRLGTRPDRAARRPALTLSIGILVAGLALYNLWRVTTYPTVLPNTFHAKTSFSLPRVWVGMQHLGGFVLGPGGALLGLGVLAFVLRRPSAMARALGWVVLAQFGYVALVGGDWMPHHRFLMPVLPLLCVLAQEGCDALAQRVALPRAASLGGVGLLLAFVLVPTVERLRLGEAPTGSHFDPHDAKRIGEFLARELPPDRFLAVEWGGIIPYYVPHRTLDTWGLTDRHIVQRDDFKRMVWGRHISPAYLARRKPDLIAGNACLLPTEAEARASVEPGGANHYSHYPRMAAPEFGYRWEFFQVAEDAWWPALVRLPDAQ